MSRALCLVVVMAVAAGVAGAVEYHDYFVGFGGELAVSGDPAIEPFVPDGLTIESFSFVGTYGPAAVRPIRLRAGIGWWLRRPFRVFAGVEVPVYETLNRARARGFGVYVLADAGLTIPLGWTAGASLAVLIPTNALGGVRIGVGINEQLNPQLTIGTATGAYPLRSRRTDS